MINTFNHYTQLNYENTNIIGYLSQEILIEILMFIKILLLLFQAAIGICYKFPGNH
jgi:hypothetical protein